MTEADGVWQPQAKKGQGLLANRQKLRGKAFALKGFRGSVVPLTP